MLVLCLATQSCPTLCNPMDCNPPGSSVHGIFQAIILEQVAISFFRWSSQPRDWAWVLCISCIGRQVPYQLSQMYNYTYVFKNLCGKNNKKKTHTQKKRLRQDVICLQSDSWQHCLNNPWVHEFVLWPRDRKEGNEEEEEVTGSLLSKSLQYRLNHVNGTCGKYPRIKTK